VRVEPQEDIDLHTVTLGEPERLYNTIIEHAQYGPAIALAQLTEKP
jgi:hypothetical protein